MKDFKKTITIIWDFDGPIGQINSTYPYNFSANGFREEQDNVAEILETLRKFNVTTCFAITGFSAEESAEPFMLSNLIQTISNYGHEIASHSWRHENFSKLNEKQAIKSLKRSKYILENLTGKEIEGFVPPHNRPMTWWRKGRFSIGDARSFPFQMTGDVNGIIELAKQAGYKWMRVSGRNLIHQLSGSRPSFALRNVRGMIIFDQHFCGFSASFLNSWSQSEEKHLTISAHPLMWSRANKIENKSAFLSFVEELKKLEMSGAVEVYCPSHWTS